MMVFHRWGLACFLSCLPIANVAADTTPDAVKQLLEKAIISARTLNYEGVFVYSHDNDVDTLRVIHKHDESGEHERLISLTGRANEIVRQRDQVHYQFADKDAYGAYIAGAEANKMVSHLAQKFDEIASLYEFHVFNGQRIAGKSTQGFLIQPRDNFRYGYQLWLDNETGLVLKSQLLGENGPVETLIYTEINYRDNIPMEAVQMETRRFDLAKRALQQEFEQRWKPSWVPEGFRMSKAHARRKNCQKLVLSDGVSMVSIFIEPHTKQAGPQAAFARNGATNGFTVINGDHRITAVGEVPPSTVQRIAQSLTVQ
jgi:sigma-E factor negative regulatory protein RseB